MEKEYLNNVKKCLKEVGGLSSIFGDYSKIYSMTTENIYGFLRNFDLDGKKVLTVAGSGDQRLNAYLMGAKNVTCFDINPLSKLHLDLKDKAIQTLNFEKFIKFFGVYSRRYGSHYHFLDERIFDEFKYLLDEDTYSLFNYIINGSARDDIYFNFRNDLRILEKMNNYLNPDSYEELSKIMKNKKIDFIESDLKSLPATLGGEKFDIILLSNISDYTNQLYDECDLMYFAELIDRLTDNLNLNGIMEVGYIYSRYSDFDSIGDFRFDEERCIYFPEDRFCSMPVNSYYGDNSHDKVIMYKKLL